MTKPAFLLAGACAVLVAGAILTATNSAWGIITPYDADVNKDAKVNAIDLMLVAQRFGQPVPTATVPAPPTAADVAVEAITCTGNSCEILVLNRGLTPTGGYNEIDNATLNIFCPNYCWAGTVVPHPASGQGDGHFCDGSTSNLRLCAIVLQSNDGVAGGDDEQSIEINVACGGPAGTEFTLFATAGMYSEDPLLGANNNFHTSFTSEPCPPPCGSGVSTLSAAWVEGNGHCYELFDSPARLTFEEAVAACEANASHLVTVEDDLENAFVWGYLARFSSAIIWLGLNDAASEGLFVWVTNEPLSYTNWSPGEAQGGALEDGVVMDNGRYGVWMDTSLSDRWPYVCES